MAVIPDRVAPSRGEVGRDGSRRGMLSYLASRPMISSVVWTSPKNR